MGVFTIKGNKVNKSVVKRFKSEKELQSLFEANLNEIFGVSFLATEFSTSHGGRIDTLGIDDNHAPVIIEYKEDEKDNVINQGLFYLDWLVDHKGDFDILVQNKLGQDIEVNWEEPRLILVAQSYNKYDEYAVNRISDNIELWKYTLYDNGTLHIERQNLPKNEKKEIAKRRDKVVFQEYNIEHHISDKSDLIKGLFKSLQEEILKMDGQIQEKIKKHYIAFALDRNFAEVVVQANSLKIYVDLPISKLNDPNGLLEDCSKVGHWATGSAVFKLGNLSDIPYAISLIRQSYEDKL